MLVQRVEDNSKHTFFNSPVGVSDWIVRSHGMDHEIQVTSAYQNYGYFSFFKSSRSLRIEASDRPSDYSELKDMTDKENQSHKLTGRFQLKAEKSMEICFSRHFLESMRAIRILQEGGEKEYDFFMKREKLEVPTFSIDGEKLLVSRQFGDYLVYRTELICAGGQWKSESPSLMVLEIPAGELELTVTLSINGFWPDEDLSAFSDREVDLLNDRAGEVFSRSDNSSQEEMTKQLQTLLLLSRKTKLFAGGPRFFTYFGRDSLISISLLSGVVIPELTIQGLRSVLLRISKDGETAHEETLGEFAALLSQSEGGRIPEALLEYHMVDDDFLLPAVLRHWMELEDHNSLKEMLSQKIQGQKNGYELLAMNLKYCISRISQGLIPYHPDIPVGDWRDSLAFQKIRFSYELNVGLAPYFQDIYTYLLDALPELKVCDTSLPNPADIHEAHRRFLQEAEAFKVEINPKKEKKYILNWLKYMNFNNYELEVLRNRLDEAIDNKFVYEFYAMALRVDKSAINIQHNDTAFSLLYGNPDREELSRMLIPFETHFPLGLRTDVGILVSNPVFCNDQKVRLELNRSHYHGLVIWPLMHNILYHGLKRQIQRFKTDRDEEIVNRMEELLLYLDNLDDVLTHFSASELLTFSPQSEGDIPLAFGANTGSTTESNPVQLWSSLGFTRSL